MPRVGVTATAVRIARGRAGALAVNVGRHPMWVGGPTVTVGTGLQLAAGEYLTLPAAAGSDDDLWAIAAAGEFTIADVLGAGESTARAGTNQTVTPGDLVTLDATGSTGPLTWTQIAGATVTLSDPGATQPTFTAPNGPDVLTFRLTAADGTMAATTVTVSPRSPTRTEALAAITSPVTRWGTTVDIYENDGSSPWLTDVPVIDGSVTLTYDESGRRRTLDCTLQNIDGALDHHPGGFWYDKVLKVHRRIVLDDDREFTHQIGEFVLPITTVRNHPRSVAVRAEDYAASLGGASKFTRSTTFVTGSRIDTVIKAIASNGGITKFNLATSGDTLTRDFVFELGTERWRAISDIAGAYGLDVFFDNRGYLTLDEQSDPAAMAPAFTFGVGTLAGIEKATSPSRIYNSVLVTGESASGTPVYGIAKNTQPGSPTRIKAAGDTGGLPERVYQFTSSFIATAAQARNVASKLLAVHALEEFNVTLESLVIPWLEAGEVVGLADPDPAPGDPTTYLLSEVRIPLRLGPMTSTAKRVTIVGGVLE